MLYGFKLTATCAAITAGLLAGAQVASAASGNVTGANIAGDWTGTFVYTSAPQSLSEQTGLITDDADYQTDPQNIVISFQEDGTGHFDFIPIINDELYDGSYRTLNSATIIGNRLAWTETISDIFRGEQTDIARTEYVLYFDDTDLTRQNLVGTFSGEFLVGSQGGVAMMAASLLQSDDDYNEYSLATFATMNLSRLVPEVQPPINAIPLPGALPSGLAVLGGLGLIGIIHQRRRSMA